MVVTTRAGVMGFNPNPDPKDKPDQRGLDAIKRNATDVNDSVRMLAEFLVADHCHEPMGAAKRYDDELSTVARSLDVISGPDDEPVFQVRDSLRRDPALPGRNHVHPISEKSRRVPLPLAPTAVEDERRPEANRAWKEWNAEVDDHAPYSSRTVVVDHDRCILCDRCVRACSEVKPFKVIGHTGKGYGTRISFDLDALMGESSCVQCGECMNSCPTGALSLRRRVQPRAWDDSPEQIPVNPNTSFPSESGFLTADEMRDIWLAYESPTRGPRVVLPVPLHPVLVPEVERGGGAAVGDRAGRAQGAVQARASTGAPRSSSRAPARSRCTPAARQPVRKKGFFENLLGLGRKKSDGDGDFGAPPGRRRGRTGDGRDGVPHPAAARGDGGVRGRAGQPGADPRVRRERVAQGGPRPRRPRPGGGVRGDPQPVGHDAAVRGGARRPGGDLHVPRHPDDLHLRPAVRVAHPGGPGAGDHLPAHRRGRVPPGRGRRDDRGRGRPGRRVLHRPPRHRAGVHHRRRGRAGAPAAGRRRLLRRGRRCWPTGRGCGPRAWPPWTRWS